MIDLTTLSREVHVARQPLVAFGDEETAFVKAQALGSPRLRARICAHPTDDDLLHEMLIAISQKSYIHPHRHFGKSESFHIVEGLVDVVSLDESGKIVHVVPMGEPSSGLSYFYRSSKSLFHTLVIRSGVLVVHEVTNGPFDRTKTEQAPFAPPEEDAAAARNYMARLAQQVDNFRQG
jgi:cupin fold WbuC family metalloprotein